MSHLATSDCRERFEIMQMMVKHMKIKKKLCFSRRGQIGYRSDSAGLQIRVVSTKHNYVSVWHWTIRSGGETHAGCPKEYREGNCTCPKKNTGIHRTH